MKEDFGTVFLITDPRSNSLLNKEQRNLPPSDSLSRWCGGKNGFDVFTERLYE
jgi:hypothetical protein